MLRCEVWRASGRAERLLDKRFAQLMQEYDDDEIGELDQDDPSVLGDAPIEVRAQLTHRIMEAEAAPATPLARVSVATETSTAAENGPKQGWLKRASSSGTALGTELRSSVPVERGADAVAVLLKKQLEVEYELEHMRGLLSSLPSFNLYSLFKAIDKTGKGHLTRADFESMMTKHRLAPTAAHRPPHAGLSHQTSPSLDSRAAPPATRTSPSSSSPDRA